MARESLADIIKREYGACNPKQVEQPRQSGGIADLAGDDLVVAGALRRFETPKERANRQRAELERITAPKEKVIIHTSKPDVSHLTNAEREALVAAVFEADAEEAVDGFFALTPEERAAVVPDMDEDELSDYLDRPSRSFGYDEEESYEDDDEDES